MNELTSRERITEALNKCSKTVCRICFMYLKKKEEAEDAFQDIFLKYRQARPSKVRGIRRPGFVACLLIDAKTYLKVIVLERQVLRPFRSHIMRITT